MDLQAKSAEIQQLKAENEKIKAENEKIKAENENITVENEKIKAENENITAENEKIKAENEKIKAENENITAENEMIKAENHQLKGTYLNATADPRTFTSDPMHNTSSWTSGYLSYHRQKRQSEPCQTGWLHFQSRCYTVGGRDSSDQRSWGGARDDCWGRDADLVLIESSEEQDFIFNSSLVGSGAGDRWIGLTFEGGAWKWLNGSDLTENYWTQPPADGHRCVVSDGQSGGWKAVSCDEKNEWICEKNALPG
ncbi:asialoglycoprotein receptor 2-like [Mugil cephalus]|uniref:asialoglycoprotein receptor 2-like n=1 Tax=Mugil cephalus TaxID=48193 RepID=UPI001FB677E0|nr:asialoglycoprotein receptor 2-like [Mugil cephalus]